MTTTTIKHTNLATWRPQNFLTPPYLVRHARLGYGIAIVCAILFALLSWQVVTDGIFAKWDTSTMATMHQWASHQPQWVVLPMRFFSAFGRDGIILIMLLAVIGWMIKKAERELSFLILGVLGSELWFQFFSSVFARKRPVFKDPFETLIGSGYPSGHAATNLAFVIMVFILLLPNIRTPWKKVVLVAGGLLYVAIVCISRLFLGLHYPTDIVGGLVLGLGWGLFAFTAYEVYWWHRRGGSRAEARALQQSGQKIEP